MGVSSSWNLLVLHPGTCPHNWLLQCDPSVQDLSLEPKPERDTFAGSRPLSVPTLLWGWAVDQLPLSISALPFSIPVALSSIQSDPIYCIHLFVSYSSLPQGKTWMAGKRPRGQVSQCLAGCLECPPNAEWINEWKDRQDGSVLCVVEVGALLGGGIDKALYQARLPK